MWITSTSGFYSAVQHRDNPAHVMVRARSEQDIVNLVNLISADSDGPCLDDIVESHTGDYQWRVTMPRESWAMALVLLAGPDHLDYDNFKNAVARTNPARAKLYHGAWDVYFDIQAHAPRYDAGHRSALPFHFDS